MILHKSKEDFQNAIRATSASLGIRDVFVEKDYWVTFVLKQLSLSKFKDEVVFKGGTSLSKAYNIISRFSEDIDLAIIGKSGLSGHQIKKKIKSIEEDLILSPLVKDTTFKVSKGSKFRKTGHVYPRVLGEYSFGHAEESLILEINAFANPYPEKLMSIESYIAVFFENTNKSYITEYELESFEVRVLGLKRTFVEKLLSLARLSISDNSNFGELKGKVRHFYDIHKLMLQEEITDFIKTKDFEDMINKALEDDFLNPEFKESWENTNLKDVRLFNEIDSVFKNIADIYKNDFSSLLYDREDIDLSEIRKTFELLLKKIPKIEIVVGKTK